MSWLRLEVTQIQASIFKEKSYTAGFCCNMHFELSQTPFNIDYPNHTFISINPNQPKLFEVVVR